MYVSLFTGEALTLTQALRYLLLFTQYFKKEFHAPLPHPLLSFLRGLSTYFCK